MTLQRDVRVAPVQDGWKSSRVEFLVHGQLGTVQFVFMVDLRSGENLLQSTYAVDVGYHWDRKRYKGQLKFDNCTVREQGKCWYDGSGLTANDWLEVLQRDGSDAVWPLMEEYYNDLAKEVLA